jgi:hypothetical protein
MGSDTVQDGWLLALHYRNNKTSKDRAQQLPHRVAAVAATRNLNIQFGIVDARKPLSASKLKAKK